MAAKENGIWDFKSYDEKGWFRFLSVILIIVVVSYATSHWVVNRYVKGYNYEYSVLTPDQMQLITRMAAGDTLKADSVKQAAVKDTCHQQGCLCGILVDYLDNTFNYKLEPVQRDGVKKLLKEAKPLEATAFLAGTRFKVESYFWLTGPSVYLEIVFWALFGVLCSLLFNLGVLGKNATSDLADPQSSFDPTEIPYQVAKLMYAPICTLAVILGYSIIKDQNAVDISSSKGMIVFAFIGGFYSSRLISLLDRLKDVLLPNSGTATMPGNNTPASGSLIATVLVKVKASDDAVTAEEQVAMGENWINSTVVKLQSVALSGTQTGTRSESDAPGVFTFRNLMPGNYTITADYKKEALINLSGVISGPVKSGKAPIELILEKVQK